MTPGACRALLAALLVLCLGWDLQAVVRDEVPADGGDSFIREALFQHDRIRRGEGPELATQDSKGPLVPLLAFPLLLWLQRVPLAMRLLGVLCHGVLMRQGYYLVLPLGGGWRHVRWAALICGTLPAAFGHCRLAHYDVVSAVAVAGVLQLLTRLEQGARWPLAGIGLLMMLGLMSKLSFIAYLPFPLLWLLLRLRRRWRPLLGLLLVGLALGLLLSLLLSLETVLAPLLGYLRMVRISPQDLGQLWESYAGIPGVVPLALAALLSTAALWRRGRPSRQATLAASWLLMPGALVLTGSGGRHFLPLVAPLAAIAGAGIGQLQEALPRRRARVLAAATAAALGAQFLALNLGALPGAPTRAIGAGMLAPDPRPYRSFAQTVQALQAHDNEVLLVYTPGAQALRSDEEYLWRFRGVAPRLLDPVDVQQRVLRGQQVNALVIDEQDLPLERVTEVPYVWGTMARNLFWFLSQPSRQLLLRRADPDGVVYRAYRVAWPPGSAKRPPWVGVQQVVRVRFGGVSGAPQRRDVAAVLGWPKGLAGGYNHRLLTLGRGGEVVVGFGPYDVVDGPGPDFIVFENASPWSPFNSTAEPAIVSVSATTAAPAAFVSYPCDLSVREGDAQERRWPFPGCAGVRPSTFNPLQGQGPEDPARVGGDPFDLAQLGLRRARYISIRDADIGVGKDGFDLDAVMLLNYERRR